MNVHSSRERLLEAVIRFQSLLYSIEYWGYSLQLPFTHLYRNSLNRKKGEPQHVKKRKCLFVTARCDVRPALGLRERERGLTCFSFFPYIVPDCLACYDLSNYQEVRVENIKVYGTLPKTMLAATNIDRKGTMSHICVVSSAPISLNVTF